MIIEPDDQTSVQCVDNPTGFPAVIVYDNQTFPFSQPQQSLITMEGPTCENAQGLNSSVRLIQTAQDGEEDTAVD